MERKDWRKDLRRGWGHLYLLNEDNEFCKIINEIDDLEDFVSREIDKAKEEGSREQAELDRALYSVSFEHIKSADFEKILLEAIEGAKEEVIKDLIKKIEEAHCDSISLELLKEMSLSKLKQ